jgi:hypothetical protein
LRQRHDFKWSFNVKIDIDFFLLRLIVKDIIKEIKVLEVELEEIVKKGLDFLFGEIL